MERPFAVRRTRGVEALLWAVIALALVAALVLAVRRVNAEGSREQVALVMDEMALAQQGSLVGLTSLELGRRYQQAGLTGVALYEQTVQTLVARGYAASVLAADLRAQFLVEGLAPPPIPSDATLVTPLMPGALDDLIAKNIPAARSFEINGRAWYVWPGDITETLPAGPDRAELQLWSAAGFDIAYRPRNAPVQLQVLGDFPPEANYLIYAGTHVAGYPGELSEVVDASQEYLTAIIEGTPQNGMAQISDKVPTVRLLSFNQDYVDRRLRPADLVDKYLLAVEERNVRLLYLRPYTTNELGDPVENTEEMVRDLTAALRSQGYEVGPLTRLGIDYQPILWLRAVAALGILAALALLALRFPAPWGAAVAGALLLGSVAVAGPDWDALALIAALIFPVLGFLTFKERWPALFYSTALSLAGALLLAAVGSERDTLLAIRPFAGVGLTLVVPPVLFLAGYMLRFHRPAVWVKRLWGAEVRVGHVAMAMVAVAALAVVILRRGNDPVIGVSQFELTLRQLLGEFVARPRFKELFGHPAAFLGLTLTMWPTWLRGTLLTAGVVAQASILNSFSHYHTPLLISLERTGVALAVGVLAGLVLLPIALLATRLITRWLAGADEPEQVAGVGG